MYRYRNRLEAGNFSHEAIRSNATAGLSPKPKLGTREDIVAICEDKSVLDPMGGHWETKSTGC
jgi:hypothetical protein